MLVFKVCLVKTNKLFQLVEMLGADEFKPKNSVLSKLTAEICATTVGKILCKNYFFALYGFTPSEVNTTLIPEQILQFPAGASTKQFLHYAQEINSGENSYIFDLFK